ncbi:MAG: hypothetical protein ABIJ75_07165 [Actinomycetota bacterium]
MTDGQDRNDTTEQPPDTEKAAAADGRAQRFMLDVQKAPITPATLDFISKTEFVPASLRGKPKAMLAAILTGRELGLGPMTSMRAIDIIDGNPTPSAELLVALVRRAGHEIKPVELTMDHAVAVGYRHDNPADPRERTDEYTHEFTFEEASAITYGRDNKQLVKKDAWVNYRKAMLWARCVSGLCRMFFSDVTLRVAYVLDEQSPAYDFDRLCARCGLHPPMGGSDICGMCHQSGSIIADEAAGASDDDVVEAEIVDDDDPARRESVEEQRFIDEVGETDAEFVGRLELIEKLEGFVIGDIGWLNGTVAALESTTRLICELLVKTRLVDHDPVVVGSDLLHDLLGKFGEKDKEFLADEKTTNPVLHWANLGKKAHMQRFAGAVVGYAQKRLEAE